MSDKNHSSGKTSESESRQSGVDLSAPSVSAQSQIIAKARTLFFSSGFRSVTMDDLARELGMSKKTLYQNFASKEALLYAVIGAKFDHVESVLDAILHEKLSIGEQMRLVMAKLHSEAAEVQPAFVRDIQRGDPALFQAIDKRRNEIIRRYLGELLVRGGGEGYVRRDVRPELMMEILLTVVQQVVTPSNLARHNLSPNEAFEQIIGVFMNGILVHPGEKV